MHEQALAVYIEECRHVPFAWGSHDCVTFADGACLVQNSKGFASDWLGKYSTASEAVRFFKQRMKAGNYHGPIAAMNIRMKRGQGFPSRGSIVARESEGQCTGFVLGVAISTKVAFVGDNGLEFSPIVPSDVWWIVE